MKNNIFVIGAKPNAIFPDVKPDKVYAANGGIAVAQRYVDENVYLNGVLSKGFLSRKRKNNKALAPTIAVLHGCRGNSLIVAGGGPKTGGYDSPEERGMTFESIKQMSRFESFFLKLRYMKYSRLFDKVDCKSRGDWVRRIFKTRDIPAMRLSTGLIALLISLYESRKDEGANIWVIGIGLDIEGQFYDSANRGRQIHLYSDMCALNDLARQIPSCKLRFTDTKLAGYMEKIRKERT